MNPCLFCRCFESWLCLFPSSSYLLSSAFASFQGHVILCLVFWSYLSSLPIEKKITFFLATTAPFCLAFQQKRNHGEWKLLCCPVWKYIKISVAENRFLSINCALPSLVVKMDGTESKTQPMERSVSVVTDSFSIHYQDHKYPSHEERLREFFSLLLRFGIESRFS